MSIPDRDTLSRLGIEWCQPGEDPLVRARQERLAAGLPVFDLVGTTAAEAGLFYPPSRFRAVVASAEESLQSTFPYRPDPLGLPRAREAVAAFYGRRGVSLSPGNVLLTPGTSMGYLAALRLLLNPGDNLLVPSPGYPLFDDLCAIAGVEARRYHLRENGDRWLIDPEEVRFQCTPRTRAIALVSPHNPTGHVATEEELAAIVSLCRERGLALLFDEVFSETLGDWGALPRPTDGEAPLVLLLNGFSKMFSLPGWKVAWCGALGERAPAFLAAAAHFLDAFLPMPDFTQATVAPILEGGDPGVLQDLNERLCGMRKRAAEALGIRDPGAGVYLTIRCDPAKGGMAVCTALLQETGALVHPGYYYDLAGRLVLTCLAPPDVSVESYRRIRESIHGRTHAGVIPG